MKWFLVVLALFSAFASTVSADTREQRVHLIYAGDQSGSMRHSHHPSWMSAQRYFLMEYFAAFTSRCQEIHVDYIAWGSEALPPVSMVLRTNRNGKEFSEYLDVLSYRNLVKSSQHKALLAAASLVTDDYDRTIIIFTSDASAGTEKDLGLWQLIPSNTEFIGISLGKDSVGRYFKQNIIPPHGTHHHVYTTTEFGDILYSVFDELGFDNCLAS